MTVVDHPVRHTAELNRRIEAEFGDQACWRASLDIGVIVILDFGERWELIGKSGPVVIGKLRVFVHGEDWFVERNGKIVLRSEQVLDEEDEHPLRTVFVGRRLRRVDWGAYCSLTFSDGLVLRVERVSDRPEHDNIVELRFPNGDCVDCLANGAVETEAGFE